MSRCITPFVAFAALALAGCERDVPGLAPTAPGATVTPTITVTKETASLEPVTQRLARALADPVFRARLYARLQASPFPEGKIHLQRSFSGANRAELRALARLNQEGEEQADSVFRTTRPLEVYLPVPAHRLQWKGDERLLVATAAQDRDIPVAYDLTGRRHLLDPTRPPQTPVLAVVPVETNFDGPILRTEVTCVPSLTKPCGGSGGSAPAGISPGLYMTAAHFVEEFEGLLDNSDFRFTSPREAAPFWDESVTVRRIARSSPGDPRVT